MARAVQLGEGQEEETCQKIVWRHPPSVYVEKKIDYTYGMMDTKASLQSEKL